jgi:outer membrane protein assembly factor BamB
VASAAGAEFYGESVSRYRRDPSGKLAFTGCFGYATAGCHSAAAWPIVGADAIQARSDSDVYVAAEAYSDAGPRDVVSHLVVGTDGRLRLSDCIAQQAVSGCGRVPAGVSALSFSRSAAISADGSSLYVAAVGGPAVTHLRIGADGRLSFGGCWGGGGCTSTVLPASDSQAVSVSPDGRDVYAAADNMVVVFRREQGSAPPAPPPPPAPAPAVRTAEADGIGPTAAILTARINPLASETTYAFDFGQTTAYGGMSPAAPAGGGSDVGWYSTRVIGLVPGTTYHYRVVAKSAAGTARGKDATFTTAPAASAPPPGLAPILEVGPQDRSVAYQVNPGHSGYLPDNRLVPPLTRRWVREFAGEVSYPVVADGKVFVMVAADTEPLTRLYALDAHTGGTLWSRGFGIAVLGPVRGLAYDQGKVFAAASSPVGRDGRGQLAAFDANTGEPRWVSYDVGYPRTSLTAAGGVVYGSGEARSGYGGEVFALRQSDGAPRWIRNVDGGARSSPALARDRVLVAYSCHMYAFTLSGGLSWSRNTGCSGAGGSTVVVAPGGRAYVRGLVSPEGAIFAANSGALIGAFPIDGDYDAPPVFARDIALFVRGDRLVAEGLTSGSALWSFEGEGGFGMAPIVAGPIVYVGSRAGTLYGLALKTGRVIWSTNAGSTFLASERPLAGTGTWPGLGAGNGLLVAPAGNRLSAYSPPRREPAEQPKPPPAGSGSSQVGATAQPSKGGATTPATSAAAAPGGKAPTGSCPPSRRLRGPVNVTAGIRSGIASLRDDALHKGRYVHRIRWEISPRYRHSLTLRAGGFSFTEGRSLRVNSKDKRGGRRMATTALLPGPGCYSVGIRGRGLRQGIVFTAR